MTSFTMKSMEYPRGSVIYSDISSLLLCGEKCVST